LAYYLELGTIFDAEPGFVETNNKKRLKKILKMDKNPYVIEYFASNINLIGHLHKYKK
jgi:hypothetical protein